jgi:O-antigen/teichoic acid export membrane protein
MTVSAYMKNPRRLAILKGTVWTTGAYGLGQLLRVATNIALTRLLAPEIFGIMVIVNALKYGVDLIADVGIGQNLIYNKNAEDPEFYNTAWTLQVIRGLLLFIAGIAAAIPVAALYHAPILVAVVPVTAIGLVLTGCTSISVCLLQRRLQIAKLNAFDIVITVIATVASVAVAYIMPTVWALVIGQLFGFALRMVGSFFLLPDLRINFTISKRYTWQILRFGRWITISSIAFFLSATFDRLYLASVVPLGLLGIYGVARTISDMLTGLIARLGEIIVFPLIASHSNTPRVDLRDKLSATRLKFLLVGGLGFSIFAATVDLPIKILLDQRYNAAAWMLPVLLFGSWFSLLYSINQSTLLGLGKPFYSALANIFKFGCLLIALPLSLTEYGLLGCIIVVSAAEMFRYVSILVGQIRERFSFGMQDFLVTLMVFIVIALLEWIRWALRIGTPFDNFTINSM